MLLLSRKPFQLPSRHISLPPRVFSKYFLFFPPQSYGTKKYLSYLQNVRTCILKYLGTQSSEPLGSYVVITVGGKFL